MEINETKRQVVYELDGKKMTGTWTKQMEDDLMQYHGLSMVEQVTKALKEEMEREKLNKEIYEHTKNR